MWPNGISRELKRRFAPLALIVLIIVLGPLLQVGTAAASTSATITGSIATLPPLTFLPGLKVWIYSNTAPTLVAAATTDVAGHYSVTVQAGSYRIQVWDPAHSYGTCWYPCVGPFPLEPTWSSAQPVSVAAGEAKDLPDRVYPNRSLLQVHVDDDSTGAPVSAPGATATAYNATYGNAVTSATTDASGNANLEVSPGYYKVQVSKPGLATTWSNGTSWAASQTKYAPAGTNLSFPSVSLAPPSSITGHLTNGWLAVANIAVVVAPAGVLDAVQYAFTDANGDFNIGNLPLGTFNIVTIDPTWLNDHSQGYLPKVWDTAEGQLNSPKPFVITAGASTLGGGTDIIVGNACPQYPLTNFPGGTNWTSLDLRGCLFATYDFNGVNLNGANLSGASLNGAKFAGATLSNTDLSGARLQNATLVGTDFTTTNLSNVTWSNTTCPDHTNTNTNGGTCVGHL